MNKMAWQQVIAIIIGNAVIFLPMFLLLRTEAIANRRDIISLLSELKEQMKDFHGRLCTIEKGNKRD